VIEQLGGLSAPEEYLKTGSVKLCSAQAASNSKSWHPSRQSQLDDEQPPGLGRIRGDIDGARVGLDLVQLQRRERACGDQRRGDCQHRREPCEATDSTRRHHHREESASRQPMNASVWAVGHADAFG
jgi:hypothetical protein